jgi:hypothetical protein
MHIARALGRYRNAIYGFSPDLCLIACGAKKGKGGRAGEGGGGGGGGDRRARNSADPKRRISEKEASPRAGERIGRTLFAGNCRRRRDPDVNVPFPPAPSRPARSSWRSHRAIHRPRVPLRAARSVPYAPCGIKDSGGGAQGRKDSSVIPFVKTGDPGRAFHVRAFLSPFFPPCSANARGLCARDLAEFALMLNKLDVIVE